jgi:hypothetical protein
MHHTEVQPHHKPTNVQNPPEIAFLNRMLQKGHETAGFSHSADGAATSIHWSLTMPYRQRSQKRLGAGIELEKHRHARLFPLIPTRREGNIPIFATIQIGGPLRSLGKTERPEPRGIGGGPCGRITLRTKSGIVAKNARQQRELLSRGRWRNKKPRSVSSGVGILKPLAVTSCG